MSRRREQPTWPDTDDQRVRVLVEHSDDCTGYAAKHVLEQAGYDVQLCGGPDQLPRHRCPLVAGRGCALAEGADIVVNGLNTEVPEARCVLEALREQHPDLPVVVELPGPRVSRHADLLAGCTVLPAPMTRSTLLDAVARAEGTDT